MVEKMFPFKGKWKLDVGKSQHPCTVHDIENVRFPRVDCTNGKRIGHGRRMHLQ